MEKDNTKVLSNVIRIDDERIQDHLGKIVRGSVEETLNALLDAEADRCQRRSKISPPGRSKTSPLNVMRYAVLGGCPGSP